MAIADKWANQAVISCVESGANTLTFKKLETGISLFEKVAWLIAKIDYYLTATTVGLFDGSSDDLACALVTSDQISGLLLTQANVIDEIYLTRRDFGTAASGFIFNAIISREFGSLPGGGLLIPPNPLYGAIKGTGLSGAATIYLKLFYTAVELKPDEYWELVESRRIISST